MAKDPAFLFYSSDFLSGVTDLTMEERGQYITLLCLQHQKGPISEKVIRLTVGKVSGDVLKKFSRDEEGNFFNERLIEIVKKRKKQADHQRENAKKRWKNEYQTDAEHDAKSMPNECQTDTKNMPLENEIENRNVIEYSIEHCLEISFRDERWFRANKADRDELENFNEYLVKQGIYSMNPADYKKYFGKLKSKYPDFVKKHAKELSLDDLKKIALELDKKLTA